MELEVRLALITSTGQRRVLQGRRGSLDEGWRGSRGPGVAILLLPLVDIRNDCVARCRQPFVDDGVAMCSLTGGSGGGVRRLYRGAADELVDGGHGGGVIPRGRPFRHLTVLWRAKGVYGSSVHVEIAVGLKGRNSSKEFKWLL